MARVERERKRERKRTKRATAGGGGERGRRKKAPVRSVWRHSLQSIHPS